MRRHTLGTLGLLLSLAPAGAWTPADVPLALQPQSRLWVDGTSTVRAFTCKAAVLEADVGAADANAVAGVLDGEKAVRGVEFRVPAAKLECGNGTMNEHMLKALKAREHAVITFRVASYDVVRGGEGVDGTLTGSLTLGGVEQAITVHATGRDAGAGILRVAGAYQLKMSDYGLKAPTLMFGTLKVGDAVTVGFDLLLKAEPKVVASH
jgi:polyisoprenoid-binding protein YceI